MFRIDFIAMGSDVSIFLDSTSLDAEQALLQAPAWFEGWEQIFSRFRPTSELSTLNRFAGYWFHASDELWEVLNCALDAAAQTNGRVTPTVLPQLLAAGYDRSFDLLIDDVAIADASLAPHPVADWRAIELDAATQRIFLPRSTALDLGGIVKGWAAERAARQLAPLGSVLVDAGGDLAVHGTRSDGTAWPIGITDPRSDVGDEERDLPILLCIAAGGVATSGRDHRRWRHGGRPQHHIIDPLTGLPAATDVLTATVVAADALSAEIAAKHLILLGSDAGLRWVETQSDVAALLVTDDGAVHTSSRFTTVQAHSS
jgi:thiamine biosynthesis lipoprotein